MPRTFRDGPTLKREGSRITLACTGRQFYANEGILGLGCDDGPEARLTGGYDESVEGGPDRLVFWERGEAMTEAFTPAERQEIGEAMIAAWTAWMRTAVTVAGRSARTGY